MGDEELLSSQRRLFIKDAYESDVALGPHTRQLFNMDLSLTSHPSADPGELGCCPSSDSDDVGVFNVYSHRTLAELWAGGTGIRETAALEEPSKVFELVSSLISRTGLVSVNSSPTETYSSFLSFLKDGKFLSAPGELDSWKLSLAAKEASPKIEAGWSLWGYRDVQVKQNDTGVQEEPGNYEKREDGSPEGCESWVEWYGKQICSLSELHRLLGDPSHEVHGWSIVVPTYVTSYLSFTTLNMKLRTPPYVSRGYTLHLQKLHRFQDISIRSCPHPIESSPRPNLPLAICDSIPQSDIPKCTRPSRDAPGLVEATPRKVCAQVGETPVDPK